MKALSVKQPWASLIAHNIKDIENRTWKTNFRGRVYIHSTAKEAGTIFELLNPYQHSEVIDYMHYNNELIDLKFSAIIGEVDIVDCVINHPSIWAEKSEIDFSDVCIKNDCSEFIEWDCGQGMCQSCKLVGQSYFVSSIPKNCFHKEKMPKPIYNWVLANPVLYDKPILNVKGKLSFWDIAVDFHSDSFKRD